MSLAWGDALEMLHAL
jgi:hypothetical protein